MITTTQVLEAFKEILEDGLHQIRATSSLPLCRLEAYHLHNIPSLLLEPARGPIDYYFTIEKPEYLAQLSTNEKLLSEQRYGDYWHLIEKYLSQKE